MASSDLKILASHPVQYHVPLYRELNTRGLEIEVGYYQQGAAMRVARDVDFGMDFQWDIDLLSDYSYRIFLRGDASYQLAEQFRVARHLVPWALRDPKTPLMLVGWFAEVIWLIWILRVQRRMPTMMLCETTPLSFAASPKPRWRVSLLRWLLQNTWCMYIGARNREFLASRGVPADRLFHAPYSVDAERFAADAQRLGERRAELCNGYGLASDLPTFLFCGKLIPKKRPLQLLEAYLAADLAEYAQLLYVGDGILRAEIERRIQSAGAHHVHLLGFLNQSQMPLAYVLGNILCLISDPTETWGLVVNEALACGRPVIVSDTVGCAPDLVGAENGWVVPLDDPQALTQTLRSAHERRSEWEAMGRAGQKKVAGHTFAHMANGIQAALSTIARTT